MKRFFIDFPISTNQMITLDGDQHKHLKLVLRANVGQSIILFCGDGFDYIAQIQTITKNATTVFIQQQNANTITEPTIQVDLCFGLLKSSDKIDLIVQKSVELGASNIIPFVSQYTNAKTINQPRLQKISNEALKQCGRSCKVIVHNSISFEQMVSLAKNYDQIIFAYERAETTQSLSNHTNHLNPKKIALIVGSEGGFSPNEAQQLINDKTTTVSLGKRILRAETACISLLSIIMFINGQMQ